MPKRGENIRKRKDGRWEGRYKNGTDKSGKATYSSVYGKTYSDVKNKLIEAIQNVGIVNKNESEYTFEKVLALWKKANISNFKGSTELKYDYLIKKHIIPYLGNYKISCINRFVLNDFVNQKLSNGRLDKKGGLSKSYIKSIMYIIKSTINFAVEEKLSEPISLHYCKILSEEKKIKYLNIAEQNILEQSLLSNTDSTKLGILISLRTGLRIGEVCALKWSDIDFNNKIIHINSTISRVKKKNETGTELLIGKPKTKASHREIPIPSDLYQKLINIKNMSISDFVISDNIEFVSPRTFEYRYHKVLKSCGINPINYHALRHTFATRCIEVGVDVKSLSEILGHADVSVTLNTYVHSSIEHKRTQLEKLSNISA